MYRPIQVMRAMPPYTAVGRNGFPIENAQVPPELAAFPERMQ
jgi:hypothetical protein